MVKELTDTFEESEFSFEKTDKALFLIEFMLNTFNVDG